MEIIEWNNFLDKDYIKAPSAITIGTFDGLHKGHIYLINKLFSSEYKEKIIFTFKNNPALFFKKKDFPGNIYTLKQKLEGFKKLGITTVVLIDFSYDFSKLSGKRFISCIISHINVAKVVVGNDFKCGNDNDITALNFAENFLSTVKVDIIKRKPIDIPGETSISSSFIRNLIKRGKIKEAENLMEFEYVIDLDSFDINCKSGYCYIEKKNIEQVLPDNGIHSLKLLIKDKILQKKIFFDDDKLLKWLIE